VFVIVLENRSLNSWHLPELGFTSDHAQVQAMNEFLAR